MNFLASPPLVVAYALAGTTLVDFATDPLGARNGRPAGVPSRHLAEPEGHPGSDRRLDRLGPVPRPVRGRVPRRRALARAWTSPPRRATSGATTPPTSGTPVLRGNDRGAPRVRRYRGGAGARQARATASPPITYLARRLDPAGQPGRAVPRRARGDPGRVQLLRGAPRQPRGDDAGHVREHPAPQPARSRNGGKLDLPPPLRGADVHLRRGDALPRGRHFSHRHRGHRVRHRLVPRLGGQGAGPPRGPWRARRDHRAHPSLQPHRHGGPSASVPGRRERRVTRSRRNRGLRDGGAGDGGAGGHRRRHPGGRRGSRSGSPRACGSIPRKNGTTSGTAGSSSTSSGSSRPDGRGDGGRGAAPTIDGALAAHRPLAARRTLRAGRRRRFARGSANSPSSGRGSASRRRGSSGSRRSPASGRSRRRTAALARLEAAATGSPRPMRTPSRRSSAPRTTT